MTMSTVFSIIAVILGFALSMTATALLASALFPHWVARSRNCVQTRPKRTFLTGLILGGSCILVAAAFSQGGGPLGFFGAVFAAATLGVTLCGSAGVAQAIGAGLPSPADAERPWQAVIRGWTVLFLASLLPILGWFLILPAALLMGFGAAALGLFPRRSGRESGRRPPPAVTDEDSIADDRDGTVDRRRMVPEMESMR